MIYLLEVDIAVHCGNCARVLLFIGRLIITRYMHEELMITCQILSPQGEPRDTSSRLPSGPAPSLTGEVEFQGS